MSKKKAARVDEPLDVILKALYRTPRTVSFSELKDGEKFRFDDTVTQVWEKVNDGQIKNLITGNITIILKSKINVFRYGK